MTSDAGSARIPSPTPAFCNASSTKHPLPDTPLMSRYAESPQMTVGNKGDEASPGSTLLELASNKPAVLPYGPDLPAPQTLHGKPSLAEAVGPMATEAAGGVARTEKSARASRPIHIDSSSSQRETSARRAPDDQPPTEQSSVTTRRQGHGTIGSVYAGNKIRHLKKDDGIPLWRKDIQYDFLKCVFEDKTTCFTRFPEGDKGFTFADLYLDTMAKSSKTSKILKEKLQHDKPAATNMAMVCLLVNFGRMNTTLNFFPEMRAQLRTYHSIPSLQARQDSSAYKQLQDAPRLKSILKGASEDVEQPGTIEQIKCLPIPRTNPVNLIFVLSQFAPRVSELHFCPPGDFFDLVMRPTLSSKSRANAFLWLMWYYLESDFSGPLTSENPFGAGIVGEGSEGLPLKVPDMEQLTDLEAEAENIDTLEEIRYGEEKQRERKRILEDDDIVLRHPRRQKREDISDDLASEDTGQFGHTKRDKGISGSRGGHSATTITPLNTTKRPLEDDDIGGSQTPSHPSRSRPKRPKRESSINRPPNSQPQRLVLKTRMEQTPDIASPAPPGAAHPILQQYSSGNTPAGQHSTPRRPRPMTQHQLALEQNRRQRIDYVLAQRRTSVWNSLRTRRENEISFARAGRLLQNLPAGYDTDDESSWGKGGICPNPEEEEDFGEAASFYLSVIRKAARRLQRWDWESVLSDEKDYPTNGLGMEYNCPSMLEGQDVEAIGQSTTIAQKPKNRWTARRDRKTIDGMGDGSKQGAPTRKTGGRLSSSGQKKSSGEKAIPKRGRARARPSTKAAPLGTPGVGETAHVSAIASKADKDTDGEIAKRVHDIDQEPGGELSPRTRSRMDDGSSIGFGPEFGHVGDEDDDDDGDDDDDDDETEEISDIDMDMSKVAGDEDSEGRGFALERDVNASHLGDEESMMET
ncbi:hypothetical protein LOZ57_006762 [Ophidiomyces ophidiicola]|uniref:uncharacterized protein n=1 Tax=Ophidiomyces ophidiicola TaxID=1387563 RepID=UPI0020C4E0E7|nr:uncharacterized protein LOZ57_006762 [Ophidiomyces ophidiicola]KAI1936485.1 hypothetical protein LOZ57_006762 [Ophidiomyces ophidiicola]KAI2053775.1 hypothetical protein LOZ43_004150 [Ophidiomyces ophidiicola]